MIKKANLDDFQSCADIIKESFITIAEKFGITQENAPNYVAFSTTVDKLRKQYDSGREMYVYITDNKIVGFFSLAFSESICELNNLCVSPAWRHNGIGEELLIYAVHRAKSRKANKLTISLIEENTELKEWYSSFGFVHTNTVKYDCFPFTCGYMAMYLK